MDKEIYISCKTRREHASPRGFRSRLHSLQPCSCHARTRRLSGICPIRKHLGFIPPSFGFSSFFQLISPSGSLPSIASSNNHCSDANIGTSPGNFLISCNVLRISETLSTYSPVFCGVQHHAAWLTVIHPLWRIEQTKRIRWVGHSEFWNSTTSRIIGISGKSRIASYCTKNKIMSKFTSSC